MPGWPALAVARFTAATLGGVTLAVPGLAAPAMAPVSTIYIAPASASWTYTATGVSARVTVTQLADTAYRVQATGTTHRAAPTTIPVSFSAGVLVPNGSYPMRSGHDTMNLTTSAATFTFSRAYEIDCSAPFTFEGEWMVVVTTAQTITVGGHTYTIGVHAPATSGQVDGSGLMVRV